MSMLWFNFVFGLCVFFFPHQFNFINQLSKKRDFSFFGGVVKKKKGLGFLGCLKKN